MENYKVYVITNDINDKVYIGSTVNTLRLRFKDHCTQNKSLLDRDIQKYGKEHFQIRLLEDGIEDIERLDEVENYYIQKYDAINSGYNDRPATSCYSRCKTMRYKDLIGMRFGRLTVIEKADRGDYGINWLCKCDCGNLHTVSGHALRRKSKGIRSCGCASLEAAKSLGGYNKAPYDTKERLYKVWKGMKRRCYNQNDKRYENYGGRGITVCDEWKDDYLAFRRWAYESGYDDSAQYQQCTIDRIDVNGNYEPSNCRWADAKEQSRNRRTTKLISYNGKQMTIGQWADYLGVSRNALVRRQSLGWSIERMLTEPLGSYEWASHRKKQVVCIERRCLFESSAKAADFFGVPASNITVALSNPHRTCAGYHWVRYNGEDINSLCDVFISEREAEKTARIAKQKATLEARKQRRRESAKLQNPKIRSYESYDYLRKKVICLETGVIFDSIKDAAAWAKIPATNISFVCKGKGETAAGYHWKYKNYEQD